MLADGSWANVPFKAYNFNSLGKQPDGGHLHPLLKLRQEYREIFLEVLCVLPWGFLGPCPPSPIHKRPVKHRPAPAQEGRQDLVGGSVGQNPREARIAPPPPHPPVSPSNPLLPPQYLCLMPLWPTVLRHLPPHPPV